ncbi:MAG: 50S ribosomal protein L32 [Saprospiraceae bacterium]|jgi:large subunit ribosomal protein L32|nr:50S ribosomal protein L32 [Saprospirales bacterium]RME05642.1 MAG: 50S ribosomal protein L32 [Bacteroidota bacterium]
MPNPKTRHSKRRTRARRTHYKAPVPQLARDPQTNETHIYHHAYYDAEGNLRYRGKVLVKTDEGIE